MGERRENKQRRNREQNETSSGALSRAEKDGISSIPRTAVLSIRVDRKIGMGNEVPQNNCNNLRMKPQTETSSFVQTHRNRVSKASRRVGQKEGNDAEIPGGV